MAFEQFLANGLIAGAIYALVAVGFALVFSTTKRLNFAHGATVVLSGYLVYFFHKMLSIDFWPSSILAILLATLAGVGFNEIVFKRLRQRKAGVTVFMIASIAILLMFEALFQIFFGADVKALNIFREKGISILGASITPLQIFIILSALAVLAIMFFVMKKTWLGRAICAVSNNKDLAEISGVDSEKVYFSVFLIASLIGAFGGVLIGLDQNIKPNAGTSLIINGYTGAVIGGISSVPGAILGGFLLGIAENLGIIYLPSGYKTGIAFSLLLIFLFLRPQGILGKKEDVWKND